MIASAYEFAQSGGVIPKEIRLARCLDRFGAQAVMGRTLSANEVNRIMAAEAVIAAYRNRAKAENWAAWAGEYPNDAELLSKAAELANG